MSQIFNPYMSLHEYVPDGEPHVFGDRVYLFGSHDKEAGDTYCMLPYVCWSAPVDDLTNWTCAGVIYRPEQDPLYDAKRLPYMFAPDVVQGNDGRFYLYYSMAGYRGEKGYGSPISVAVCDCPDGEYQFLGVVKNPDGSTFMKYANFDPAVMNDDGVIRLYSGTWYPFDQERDGKNDVKFDAMEAEMFIKDEEHVRQLIADGDSLFGPHHMTLADDMLTLTSEPVRLQPIVHAGTQWEEHGFFEGSSIRKIGDTYYFVYSSIKNHELVYATSKYPDRDFTYQGTIVSTGDVGLGGRSDADRLNHTGTTHGSIVKVKDQWYVFYHRLTHKTDYSRQACAERIEILSDGSIPQVEVTSCGLNGGPLVASGTYPAAICCNLTNGHMPHGSNQKLEQEIPYVGTEGEDIMVRDIADKTWIGYKYFDFADGISEITVVIRGKMHGTLSVFQEMGGEERGNAIICDLKSWTEVTIPVTNMQGISGLFFYYEGSGSFDLLEFLM